MKGIIFTQLSRLIEETQGIACWNEVLEEVQPASQGIYVGTNTYPDEELMDIVHCLSQKLHTPITDLLYNFGAYLFPVFAQKYAIFIPEHIKLKEFLKTVDQIIHVEVLKLYPEASTPTINCEDPNDNTLTMLYSSQRKLCPLALGLIHGASTHFKEKITVNHTQCMHHGHPHCRIEINFTDA